MKFQVLQKFKLKTSKGVLELYEGQTLEAMPEKVIRFVNSGKIKPIDEPKQQPELTFESVFKDAVGEINKNYTPGAIEYARQTHPERYENGIKAENRLNQLWDDGKDLEAFQKAASEWKLIQLEMIKLYKE